MTTTTMQARFALLSLSSEMAELDSALERLAHEEGREDATQEEVAQALQDARVAARLLDRKAKAISDIVYRSR